MQDDLLTAVALSVHPPRVLDLDVAVGKPLARLGDEGGEGSRALDPSTDRVVHLRLAREGVDQRTELVGQQAIEVGDGGEPAPCLPLQSLEHGR